MLAPSPAMTIAASVVIWLAQDGEFAALVVAGGVALNFRRVRPWRAGQVRRFLEGREFDG